MTSRRNIDTYKREASSSTSKRNRKARTSPKPVANEEEDELDFYNTEDELLEENSETIHSSENRSSSLNTSANTSTNRTSSDGAAAPEQQRRCVGKNDTLMNYCILVTFIGVILIAYAMSKLHASADNKEFKRCSFEELKKFTTKQDAVLWKSLSVGIENIINERLESPSVYLFLHQGGNHIQQFVADIANAATACFDNEMHPVEMSISDFTSERVLQDYGYAIEEYKSKVKEGSVILIANLNEIPAEAARALHSICDSYSPIVKNVIIFLTLQTPQANSPNKRQTATNTLRELWESRISENELGPLITRVTDQVLSIHT